MACPGIDHAAAYPISVAVQIVEREIQGGLQQGGFVADRSAGKLEFVEFALEAVKNIKGQIEAGFLFRDRVTGGIAARG